MFKFEKNLPSIFAKKFKTLMRMVKIRPFHKIINYFLFAMINYVPEHNFKIHYIRVVNNSYKYSI